MHFGVAQGFEILEITLRVSSCVHQIDTFVYIDYKYFINKETYYMNFKFKNNQELFKALEVEIQNNESLRSSKKLTAVKLIQLYFKVAECKCVVIDKHDYVIFYPNYDDQTYTEDPAYLRQIIAEISYHFDFDIHLRDADIKLAFASKLMISRYAQEMTMSELGLIEVNNSQIYDAFSNLVVPRDQSVYYFNSYDIDPFRKPNPSSNYYKAAELLFQSWGRNNSLNIRTLKLLTYLAFIGYGANLWCYLVGPGLTGKSTFRNMLINIAGRNSYRHVSTSRFFEKGNFDQVSPFDKILIDEESAIDRELSPIAMCELKLFIDDDSSRVCTKYEPIKLRLQNRGLKLKESWQIPHFYSTRLQRLGTRYETASDNSLLDRFIMIPFGSLEHVHDKEFKNQIRSLTQQSISKLINDQDFLNEVIAIILDEFAFKNEYTVAQELFDCKLQIDSELRLYDVERFFEACEVRKVFTQDLMPAKAMYEAYVRFQQHSNSRFEPLPYHTFKAQLFTFLKRKKISVR